MHALQLVTTPRSFFDQQIEVLEARGIDCTVVRVHERDGSRTPANYPRFAVETIREALTGDYDLVHANYGLIAPIAIAQPTRPVVLTFWGTDLMGPGWLRHLSRASARAADAVILPTEGLRDRVPVEGTVVPFGVDTERFRPIPRDEARAYVGWDRDERIVLFPYSPERDVKNYPLAVRTVERAATDATIRTMSEVDYEDVPYYMNAADCVLVTSKRESGPMTVKEATACNVPVVATDVGFVRDVLEGVAHSHVCRTTDELVAGLEDALASGGRSDGRNPDLGLEEMGDRFVEVYESVLGRSIRPPLENAGAHAGGVARDR